MKISNTLLWWPTLSWGQNNQSVCTTTEKQWPYLLKLWVKHILLFKKKREKHSGTKNLAVCLFVRDMAPEGSTLEDSNRNLDEVTDLALQLQGQTGVRVLWVTCNLFAHQRSLFFNKLKYQKREAWEFHMQNWIKFSKISKKIYERFLSCDRYMNGAATNPDCHVLAYAGAQLKKGLDIAKKLGAENFGTIKYCPYSKHGSVFLVLLYWF